MESRRWTVEDLQCWENQTDKILGTLFVETRKQKFAFAELDDTRVRSPKLNIILKCEAGRNCFNISVTLRAQRFCKSFL